MERMMEDPTTAGSCVEKRGGRKEEPEPWERRGLQHAEQSWVGCPEQEEEKGESCPCKTPRHDVGLAFFPLGWRAGSPQALRSPARSQPVCLPVPQYQLGAGLWCHWGAAGSWVAAPAARFIPRRWPCSVCLACLLRCTANETPLTPGLRR